MQGGTIINACILLIALVASPTARAGGSDSPDGAGAARRRAQEILQLAQRGEYRQAIAVGADYELEVLSRYQPPTYEMGLYQSEAEHIAFHSPFDGWKRIAAEDLGLPKEIVMAGFNILLALEGPSPEERLVVICMNAKQLGRRAGMSDMDESLRSDRGLLLAGQLLSASFGIVKSHRFQMTGDQRVLWLEIESAGVGPDMRAVLLLQDGRIFFFVLLSPLGDVAKNQKRLEELVKTTSFAYKPEDKTAVTTAREKSNRQEAKSLLECVERLCEFGEYNAAAEDLAELRVLLHGRLPKASVNGNTASCPAYGVTLKNPDPDKWKLSLQQEGGLTMLLLLLDKTSVDEEGIMVGVLDVALMYGPQIAQMMEDEEAAREFLAGGGRGGAMSTGQIESERFTTIKGNLTYEAIVVPNLPGMKGRVQVMKRSGHAVMVVLLRSAHGFEAKLAEGDRIIENCLALNDVPGQPEVARKRD